MKILFVSDNFYPETNAAASRVYERAQYWSAQGHEVTVITSCPNFPEGKPFVGYKNRWRFVEEIKGIRVVRVKTFMAPNQGVGRRMLDFISFMVSGFFFSIFEKKPDVVMASSPQFFAAISGYWTSVFKRAPFVLEIADLWPESVRAVGAVKDSWFLDFMEKVELFLYHRADIIVTLTHAIAQNMVQRGVDSHKIATIINGVNLDFFTPQVQKDQTLVKEFRLQNKFVVGYIGTFGMAHDLTNLLKAAQILRDQGDDHIHFMIVGAGAEKQKLLQFRHQNDLDNVSIVPRQSKDQIQRYWSVLDLSLVHLKNSTTFRTVIPSKIFEAMAVACPILYCGPESDGSMIVTKEKVGVQIESGVPEKLKDLILELSRDPKTMEFYRQNTQAAVKSYTREQQAHQVIQVIEKQLAFEPNLQQSISSPQA